MYNIIKSLDFQTRRDNFTYYSIILGGLLSCMTFLDNPNAASMTGCDHMAALGEGILAMTLGYVLMLLISRICGWDHSDKTINYEILSGHSKREVYFARVIVSFEWGLIFAAAVLFLPITAATLINGFGENMSMSGALLRLSLMLLPVIRLISAFILISFIARKFISALILCFFIVQGEIIFTVFIPEVLPEYKMTVETAITNIFSLGEMNSRMGFIDGKDIMVYDTSLGTFLLLGTVIISLLAGILYISLGYVYFKKNDMQ